MALTLIAQQLKDDDLKELRDTFIQLDKRLRSRQRPYIPYIYILFFFNSYYKIVYTTYIRSVWYIVYI